MPPVWRKTKVRISTQVEAFVKSRAPESRNRLKRAIKALGADEGNIRSLEGRLSGYSRLRVGGCRVIFSCRFEHGVRYIDCVFAEARPVVYDLFEKILAADAGQR